MGKTKKQLAAIMIIILLTIVCNITSALAEVKLICNTIYPANSLITKGLIDFANLVKEYSKGSIIIEVHPEGNLGYKGPELLGAVKDGVIPMSDILMGAVQDSERVFGLSSLPRMVKTYDEAMDFYNNARHLYEKAAEKWNQKILYVAPWTPTGIFTKNEIKYISDFKGLRIKVYNKELEKLFIILSANPIFLSWRDLPEALKEGKIDAVITPTNLGVEARLWEHFKYFMPLHLDFPLNMVTINLKVWDSLSREQQAAIERAAAETRAKQWGVAMIESVEAIKTLVSMGVIMSVGEGSNSETKPGIKIMAASGVIPVGLRTSIQTELDAAAKKIIDNFIATAGKEIADFLKAYMSLQKK